jgi:hypothetical protein
MSSLIDPRSQVDPSVPRVGGDSLWRKTYAAWLDDHAVHPLRFVVAQPGAGKTTATAFWAQRRARRTAWITLPPKCSAVALWAGLQDRLGLGGVFRKLNLSGLEPVDVVIDDLENALPDARRVLADLYRFAGDGITFVYLSRTAQAVDIRNGQSAGLVAYGDGSLLRFDAAEVAQLCEVAGVPYAMSDCDRLCHATGGWATAVAGSVFGMRGGATMDEAYAAWRRHSAPPRYAREPAFIEMFGRFRMIAGGREVRFERRRDAQIVQYLALRPDGCASRTELVETFWPRADKQLAAQRLRTGCSAIRRALAACVGRDAVEHYFATDAEIVRLRFESVVNSVNRFRAHADLAISAAQRCEGANVHTHSAAALRLYTAPLLSGKPVAAAGWIDEAARELAFIAGVLRELNAAVAHPHASNAASRIAAG